MWAGIEINTCSDVVITDNSFSDMIKLNDYGSGQMIQLFFLTHSWTPLPVWKITITGNTFNNNNAGVVVYVGSVFAKQGYSLTA